MAATESNTRVLENVDNLSFDEIAVSAKRYVTSNAQARHRYRQQENGIGQAYVNNFMV